MTKRFLSGATLCGLMWVLGAAVPSAQDMRPSEVAYKNIRVLTGVPANQVIQGMHVIKTSLGVDCTYCHVEAQWDREDVQPMKNKARSMMAMVKEINDNNFEGRQVVTCFTCHKGKAIPEDAPPMPAPPITEHISTEIYPPVDDLLKKYVTALGGEAALKKVTSRVITASVSLPTGPGGTVSTPATLERSLKAPNLAVDVYTTAKFSISNGFDGKAPWAKGQNGNVNSPPPTSPDAERLARAANFYEPLMLRDLYATMRVVGREKVREFATAVGDFNPAYHDVEAARALVPLVRDNAWFFDSELLLVAQVYRFWPDATTLLVLQSVSGLLMWWKRISAKRKGRKENEVAWNVTLATAWELAGSWGLFALAAVTIAGYFTLVAIMRFTLHKYNGVLIPYRGFQQPFRIIRRRRHDHF